MMEFRPDHLTELELARCRAKQCRKARGWRRKCSRGVRAKVVETVVKRVD